jgi:uroporphyrinogen-III synthase
VCIGETTAAALKRRYQGEFLISSGISAEGLAETILQDHRR